MKVFTRVCIRSQDFLDPDDHAKTITLERGRIYTTGDDDGDQCRVFTTYWFKAPLDIFAGKEPL